VTAAATEDQAVVIPRSREEAIAAFGDGSGVTVMGGGTILMPELTAGRARRERVLLLARAGLDQIDQEGDRMRIGATVRVAQLLDAPEPLASAARGVGDAEIRGQATVGGNLCAGPGPDFPRGDLQGPLIALGATVRSAGATGERTEPVEEFLAGDPTSRLVLEVELDAARTGAWAALERPHAHSFTPLAVAASVATDGSDLRVAASGAGPYAVRLRSVESGGVDGDPERALEDVTLVDDAVASAWYREKMLPVLVARAFTQLKERA
jgi:CO/xanthine dehydrogenase FAD-binding subunit